jgi:hypothetical protein
LRNRIFPCISIERRIQDAANAAILGTSLAESSHAADDDKRILSEVDDDDNVAVVVGDGMGHRERSGGNGGSIQFSVGGNDEKKEVLRRG